MDSDRIKYFFPKLINRLEAVPSMLWPYCNMERWAMRGYSAYVDAAAFKTRLASMLGDYTPALLEGISNEDRDVIIKSAEQALRHEFDLLGSGTVKSDPIDWHTDLKSGIRWEKQYYRKIGQMQGADIKMPWELSRCQHFLWLGEAYLLTGDDRYAKEVVDEICWWIDDNPLMYSVNWKCAMDVAFRAANWMFALNMIAGYSGYDEAFSQRVMRSLWQHGFFIRTNLEKSIPDSNNHYTSDLVGLLYIGELYRWTRKGESWRKYALKELIAETRSQVLPSGVHYEKSVSYHRMMTEMLSYPAYMLKRGGDTFPKDVHDRLQGMYGYVANYTKPNGFSPLIADNDDGRFVPFLKRDFRYHNYLNDPMSLESRFVAAGMQPMFCSQQKETKCYSDAGVAIVRQGDHYLFINNGGYSKLPRVSQSIIATHTHNDLLSFELALNGADVIVDAGTYLYTSSKKDRDAFRASAKHNTIVVDGEEQNEMFGTFSLKRNVRIECLYEDNGSYAGKYQTISGQMNHKRKFILQENGLVIIDEVSKPGMNHEVVLYFHCASGIEPLVNNNKVELINGDISINFSQAPKMLEVVDDTLSPSFGVMEHSKTLKVTYCFDSVIRIETEIIRKK